MCYRVHTHTMACDVRPVISSTKTLYLDPYETPPNCICARRAVSRSERCPSHGCCRLSSALYRCPRDCRRPLNYHRYVCDHDALRSRRQSFSHPHSRRSQGYYYRPPTPPPARKPWRDLRVFDRDPDFHTRESADLRFAISEMLDIGRILLHAEAELEKARLRVDRERQRHMGAHGGCERILNTWECAWNRRIAEMVREADDLKLSTEVLAECWVKYVGLLRKYEGLGQRRVSGILEDPTRTSERTREKSRHRREERSEEKPWRYLRRESWGVSDDSGRERGRERERERRSSTRETYVDRRSSRQEPPGEERRRTWWQF